MDAIASRREFHGTIPARELFVDWVLRGDQNIPMLVPQDIEGIELEDGDGRPGSIKLVRFAAGIGIRHLKLSVDILDNLKMICMYTTVGDEELPAGIEFIKYKINVESSCEEGCKGTIRSTYHRRQDAVIDNVENIEGNISAFPLAMFKAGCIIANPVIRENNN